MNEAMVEETMVDEAMVDKATMNEATMNEAVAATVTGRHGGGDGALRGQEGRPTRRWVSRTAVGTAVAMLASLVGVLVGVPAASAAPWLSFVRSIQTRPFVGTTTSMGDDEGLAYVPANDTLWAIDDSPGRLYEVNRTTGALGQVIPNAAFQATTNYAGTGETAGQWRVKDLEAVAYDAITDTLYAFSGTCCTVNEQPTVFRLTRPSTSAAFALESWQPLAAPYNDLSGAGFRNGELWVAMGKTIVRYDYATNTATSPFTLTGAPSAIYGIGFNPSGSEMWLVGSSARLTKFDWATKTPVPGYSFATYSFGVNDPRAVELIGTQLFLADGYDYYPAGSTSAFGIRVFDLVDATVTAPVASFTATPTSGASPLTVVFTDTSTNIPVSWSWAFGDGTTSKSHSPTKIYSTPGIYYATLTATNPGGSSTSVPVAINVGNVPVASFTRSVSVGAVPLTVTFTDTSTNSPTAWSWNFGDGSAPGTTQTATHVFQDPGVYNVTLTATNANGSNTSGSQTVSVTTTGGALTTTFIATEDASIDQTVTIPKPTATNLYNLNSTTAAKRSYIKFAVAGLNGAVTAAKLRLWVTDGTDNGAPWYLLDTNAWSQSTITYANAPPVNGPLVGDPGVVPLSAWLEVDVTSAVAGDGTYSFANIPQSTNQERYTSTEGVDKPQLVITTNVGGAGFVPASSFTTSASAGTAPLAVTFTDTSTNSPTSWSWNFGDGSPVSTLQNPSHTFTTAGVRNVTLTATNAAGSNTSVAQAITVNAPPAAPVASFTKSASSGPAPLTVGFSDTSTNSPTAWSWNFGDGSPVSLEQFPTHTYTAAGSYNVTLTATNEIGSNTSSVQVVTVSAGSVAPVASFTKSASSGTAPLAVTFTDTSTNSPTSWSWNFGDGTPVSTLQNPSHTFTGAGTFNVTLTATNAAGSNTSTSQPVSVTSSGTVTTTFIPSEDASVDQKVKTARPTATTLNNLVSTSSARRSYIKFAVSGLGATVSNAKLRLWVTNGTSNGARWYLLDTNAWSQATITFANAPPVTGAVVGDPGVVPTGAWLEVDVTSAVSGNGTFSFATVPQSTDEERYTSLEGVNKPQLVITTVSSAPVAPVASFTKSVSSGTAPLAVTFTDTSSNSPTSWSWDFGDGSPVSTLQHPSHTFTGAGTFDVTLTAGNSAGSNTSVSQAVTVSSAPVAPVASFTKSVSSGTAPLAVTFTDTSSNSPTSWSWNFGDGSPVSTLQHPSHTFTGAGTFDVTLTAGNSAGSNTSVSQAVTVTRVVAGRWRRWRRSRSRCRQGRRRWR